jgi:hypothetical protein
VEGLSDGAEVGAVGFIVGVSVVGLIVGVAVGKLVGLTVLLLHVPQDTGHSF